MPRKDSKTTQRTRGKDKAKNRRANNTYSSKCIRAKEKAMALLHKKAESTPKKNKKIKLSIGILPNWI